MSVALEPLWKIDETLLALMESIETCPDEMRDELQADIEIYLGKEAAKVDQTAHVLAAMDYERKACMDEIDRLADRMKAAKKAQDRLEAYLCRIISARGAPLKGNTNTLSVRTSDAVVITDVGLLPDIYRPVQEVQSVDKTAIKKALKAGAEVSGADLEFRNNLVRR